MPSRPRIGVQLEFAPPPKCLSRLVSKEAALKALPHLWLAKSETAVGEPFLYIAFTNNGFSSDGQKDPVEYSMIKYLIQTSPHDVITSQEVVGVFGVEEGEKGVAELGPIAVLKKGQGVLAYDFFFLLEFF